MPNLEEWLTQDWEVLLEANRGGYLKQDYGGTIQYQRDVASKRKKIHDEIQEFKKHDKTKS